MFRADLKRRFETIFDFPKTTYNAPNMETPEQDILFIQIFEAKSKISQGRQIARVTGSLVVFAQANKFPFGYLTKRIDKADREQTAPLFFHDIDTDVPNSPARVVNLHERRTGFVFLYDAQYDPTHGLLTSLEFQEV